MDCAVRSSRGAYMGRERARSQAIPIMRKGSMFPATAMSEIGPFANAKTLKSQPAVEQMTVNALSGKNEAGTELRRDRNLFRREGMLHGASTANTSRRKSDQKKTAIIAS